jgi:hypothetical protein
MGTIREMPHTVAQDAPVRRVSEMTQKAPAHLNGERNLDCHLARLTEHPRTVDYSRWGDNLAQRRSLGI